MSGGGFAVFTPLMKSRDARAGWFAFATDVDNLRMLRWRVSRELVSPVGAKPRERLKLTEASCPMLAGDDNEGWSRAELIGYPADLLEAGAMVLGRFERLTVFRLEGESP